jgi:hypothetical protein
MKADAGTADASAALTRPAEETLPRPVLAANLAAGR